MDGAEPAEPFGRRCVRCGFVQGIRSLWGDCSWRAVSCPQREVWGSYFSRAVDFFTVCIVCLQLECIPCPFLLWALGCARLQLATAFASEAESACIADSSCSLCASWACSWLAWTNERFAMRRNVNIFGLAWTCHQPCSYQLGTSNAPSVLAQDHRVRQRRWIRWRLHSQPWGPKGPKQLGCWWLLMVAECFTAAFLR